MQHRLHELRAQALPLRQSSDQVTGLGPDVVGPGVHLLLPQQQQGQPLGQVRVAPDLRRRPGDAHHRHDFPVEANGHVDAVAQLPGGVVLLDGDDLTAAGRLVAPHVVAVHPLGVRAGPDPPIHIDEVDVVVADGFQGVHDLLGQEHVDALWHDDLLLLC